MALQEYQEKRDFRRTPEPQGGATPTQSGRSYVIQKHAATRLHYDFRLELDGVLKSWAVPKGPSLDPAERRLAVHVEDHPVAYGSFEGVIPPHEYGGGTVMIWDRGEWEPIGDPHEGYRRGRLKFRLKGRKLRGAWTLVRMRSEGGRENWLLIKEKDDQARAPGQPDILAQKPNSVATRRTMERIAADSDRTWSGDGEPEPPASEPAKRDSKSSAAKAGKARPAHSAGRSRKSSQLDPSKLNRARPSPQPAFIEPQLATLVREVPGGPNWLHELKFDGYRMLAVLRGGNVRLITRREQDWTGRFPGIAEALSALPLEQAILDGELVVLRPDGVSDFQLMQNALRGGKRAGLVYYLFDLPHCGGYDLTRTPLLDRKEFLRRILDGQPPEGSIRYSDHIVGEGATVFQHACRYAMEGIICKQTSAPYESGRTNTWVKVKCVKRQEFVIGGYTDPSGSRIGFGALLLGYYDEQGRLRYCGKVGTGFNASSLRQILKSLKALETKQPPFHQPPRGSEARGAHWTRPELVAEIEFSEWTDDGHLRHPSFQGLREDKSPREVVREEPEAAGNSPPHAGSSGKADARKPPSRSTVKSAASPASTNVAGVTLTNADRVLYPEQGLTKRDLAEYYSRVADHILPHVAGRPLSLVRCPEGQAGECFFQKHLAGNLPPALRGIPVHEKGGTKHYCAIDDLAGLISLVQIGVLEIHTWGSREGDIERPDHIVFDLDPGPDVSWKEVVHAARLVRDHLSGLKLESFVKTSGGKGLHVVVPIRPGPDWEEVKEFASQVASAIAGRQPGKYTAIMSKSKRSGRVFIDYLRNARGATAVAPYSTRARPGAPVSTPLRWDELSRIDGAAAYTVENLPKRLARTEDPWAGYFKTRQTLRQSES